MRTLDATRVASPVAASPVQANRWPRITAIWITRITRVLHRSADGMCQKCCSAETTKRFANGGRNVHGRRLCGIAPTCSRTVLNVGESPAFAEMIHRTLERNLVEIPARIALESMIVRCVLAQPERVCREIMS